MLHWTPSSLDKVLLFGRYRNNDKARLQKWSQVLDPKTSQSPSVMKFVLLEKSFSQTHIIKRGHDFIQFCVEIATGPARFIQTPEGTRTNSTPRCLHPGKLRPAVITQNTCAGATAAIAKFEVNFHNLKYPFTGNLYVCSAPGFCKGNHGHL